MNKNIECSVIIAKLRQVATDIFHGANRDGLTVKLVRNEVEKQLGLEKGSLQNKEWNYKTKTIIEYRVEQLLSIEEEILKQRVSKNIDNEPRLYEGQGPIEQRSLLLQLDATNLQAQKFRTQKSATDGRMNKNEDLFTKFGSENYNGAASKRCRLNNNESSLNSRRDHKNVSNKTSSGSEMGLEIGQGNLEGDAEYFAACVRSNLSSKIKASHRLDQSPERNIIGNEKLNASKNTPELDILRENILADALKEGNNSALDSSRHFEIVIGKAQSPLNVRKANDSDRSLVINEPPLRIGKKRSIEDYLKTSAKTPQNSQEQLKGKNLSSSTNDEVTLKTLQSQLRKCGIRTIWYFELKEYGEDIASKILHLKRALKSIGMTSRFSESKAREIKETRESMANIEAMKERGKIWDLGLAEPEMSNQHLATAPTGLDGKGELSDVSETQFSQLSTGNIERVVFEQKDDGTQEKIAQQSYRRKSLRGNLTPSKIRKPRKPNVLDWLEYEEDSD